MTRFGVFLTNVDVGFLVFLAVIQMFKCCIIWFNPAITITALYQNCLVDFVLFN
jgi:hypothetical protein